MPGGFLGLDIDLLLFFSFDSNLINYSHRCQSVVLRVRFASGAEGNESGDNGRVVARAHWTRARREEVPCIMAT